MDTRKNKFSCLSKLLLILCIGIGLIIAYFKYYFPSGDYVATNSCIFGSFNIKWSEDTVGIIISNQQSEHFNNQVHDTGRYYLKFPIVTKGFKKFIAFTNKNNEITYIQINKHWGNIITMDYQKFSMAVLDTVYSDRKTLTIIPFSDNMIFPSVMYKEGDDCDMDKVNADSFIFKMRQGM